jgi:serine/threonine-protein kinase RsbW
MAATGGAHEHGIGPSAGPSALAAGLRWRRVFPGEERELRLMRRWLATLLPVCPARGDVAAVATELASNAIRHTASGRSGWFSVEITWHRPAVRVAVTDCGARGGPRVIDDPAGEHGRGLLVVRGLSARSGVCGDERGRMVWADVLWGDDAGAAEPGTPQDCYEAAIRDGQASLASRFAGVLAWFGRSTLQWWALADDELVAAPSAQALASLLGRVLDHPPPWPPAVRDTAREDASPAQAAGLGQRPGISAPQFPVARAS